MIDPILKQEIERASGVREWNPSEADLIQISRETPGVRIVVA